MIKVMKRGSRFQRFLLIFGLAILIVCLPVMLQKASRIKNKFEQAVQAGQHIVKWQLNPGSTVITEQVSSQPLSLAHSGSINGPLSVNTQNPRYFVDGAGKVVFLAGAHTWHNFQDSGRSNPPPQFDYNEFLKFLEVNNHNLFRLWAWEQSRWSLDSPSDDYWFSPMPYQRVGTEQALDGLPKFDLNQFNPDYFDRLRSRVIAASNKGIYVSVMLFNGWSVASDMGIPGGKNPWRGHPFNAANNINGINGDLNGDDSGTEIHELKNPEITRLQEIYVKKVVDTIGDLDNVLYEISNESHTDSTQWQYHLINFIKNYEASRGKQHPVGMTVAYPNGDNAALFASPADWISPNGDINNPPIAEGHKVILADTDHLCGVCGDRQWVWKGMTNGENLLFMDVYDGGFDLIVEPVPQEPLDYTPWVSIRRNLGYALTYANRVNLERMNPHPELASSEYCLANPARSDAEYLVYVPLGNQVTVDLSATQGDMRGEWLNPESGLVITQIQTSGGGRRSFTVPFEGDAVLYLESI